MWHRNTTNEMNEYGCCTLKGVFCSLSIKGLIQKYLLKLLLCVPDLYLFKSAIKRE